MANYKKTYVLDTNVLIQDPESLFKFQDNDVVLADVTIEELDNLKKAQGEVGYSARKASRLIEELRLRGDLLEGVELGEGKGSFRIEINHICEAMPKNWDMSKPDNNIIRVAKGLSSTDDHVILVSKDLLVRIKAEMVKVKVEDYENEKVDEEVLTYNGRNQIYVTSDIITCLYKNGYIPYENQDIELHENEFVLLIDEANFSHTGVGRFTDGKIVKLKHEKETPFDVISKNLGQKCAMEALLEPASTAPLVILKGPAGTAKTFLSLACGLEQVYNTDKPEYRNILMTRANVSFDADIGALPGNEIEKVNPLLRGCLDNIELLVDSQGVKNANPKIETQGKVEELFERGVIDIQALSFLRGRSITKQYLIVDEAQNTSPNQMLGILTRAGEGTKIVICGDLDQIDNTKLDRHSNGLAFALEKMRGSNLCWILGFTNDECTRSPLAMEAAARMVEK